MQATYFIRNEVDLEAFEAYLPTLAAKYDEVVVIAPHPRWRMMLTNSIADILGTDGSATWKFMTEKYTFKIGLNEDDSFTPDTNITDEE